MKKTPYVTNVEEKALTNENFRQVLHTTDHLQLVAMSLDSGEDIGEEVHELDQFLRIEKGSGKAVLDGREYDIADGFAVLVPAGTRHNIINTGRAAMKLYTLYGPPDHREGVIHKTKADALADTTDHYEG